ncbi:MAG: glycoside hydrolase family 3 C-terminal domain-containing protein [Croceibacterium sp.]
MLAPARPAAAQALPPARATPEQRAAAALAQMTLDEKLTLLMGYFSTDFARTQYTAPPEGRAASAGYVPGIPRLGIPAQWQTDAGMGVASQGRAAEKRARTALPSTLATAATWDPQMAFFGGQMIGNEARADGFNVMLAGSVNLMREPRNGRNFEYAGEDPLLAGAIVGAQIAGIQTNPVISTAKHYAVNDQETDRGAGNSVIGEAALRTSDLLAFQFALERGRPGAVMCAYNRINGSYGCEHPFLLTQILRTEWQWPGYVLTDWGAAHSTAPAANAGLDQESGYGLQRDAWFGADKLKAALGTRKIDQRRIDLMATRVLTALYAHGLVDHPATPGIVGPLDMHRWVTQRDAEAGIVLLKNLGGLLPLVAKTIAVIGGHADKGVISGGGSSQVYPDGVNAVPGIAPTEWPGPVVYYPSSPLDELRTILPGVSFTFTDGADAAAAARAAAAADVAIVFATQWATESVDVALTLDGDQDRLIEAVANANRKTIVVLETGGPVLMPWAGQVPAIVEAWYPGRMGGLAIARVLSGQVSPSGRLPATFPRSLDQLPHPEAPHKGDVDYTEGAAVGYKWFDKNNLEPLFAFGHGLSYTSFGYGPLSVTRDGDGFTAKVAVTNTGARRGSEVVQLYVSGGGWEAPRRLGGFSKVELAPGERALVELRIDPRLLAVWDVRVPGWSRAAGRYHFSLAQSSRVFGETVTLQLPAGHLTPQWRP